jgi:hypothetical protein
MDWFRAPTWAAWNLFIAGNLLRTFGVDGTSKNVGSERRTGPRFHSFNLARDLTTARWGSVLLGTTLMVLSLLAYFCSMVAGFVAIMAILIGLGDSQMRTAPLLHYPRPAVSVAETTPAAPPRAKVAEQEKAGGQNKPEEAQKPTQSREDAKKIARAKVARERKREVMQARLRQQREQRDDALAWGYANQPFNAPTYAPFGQRTEY